MASLNSMRAAARSSDWFQRAPMARDWFQRALPPRNWFQRSPIRNWFQRSPMANSESLPTSQLLASEQSVTSQQSVTPPPSPERANLPLMNSDTEDELKTMRRFLRCLTVDTNGAWGSVISWCFFLTLAIIFPVVLCVLKYQIELLGIRGFSVQVGLAVSAFPAFLTIRGLLCQDGLTKSLFLDELRQESFKVQSQLMEKLRIKHALFFISIFIFAGLDIWYKWHWFQKILSEQISPVHSHDSPRWLRSESIWLVLLAGDLICFMHRSAIILVCAFVLHVHCILQFLRMEDFAEILSKNVDSATVYKRVKSIHMHLGVISTAHQLYLAVLLVVATGGQLWSVILVHSRSPKEDLLLIAEAIVCSLFLAVSLTICLLSAVQITCKVQAIKDDVFSWHAQQSLTMDTIGSSMPQAKMSGSTTPLEAMPQLDTTENDGKIQYQQRVAICKFIEAYRGGISVYGFVLDKNRLQTVCYLQYAITTWVLGKTMFPEG